GWFYGTDHCDMALKEVRLFELNTKDPEIEKAVKREKKEGEAPSVTQIRDKAEGVRTIVETDPETRDFYNSYDPLAVTPEELEAYRAWVSTLTPEEAALLRSGKKYYQLTFENTGGLIMPLIVQFTFEDGTSEIRRIPAEIWRRSEQTVTKVFALDREAQEIILDPYLETADVDLNNNFWPPRQIPTRFELFKEKKQRTEENPMQRARKGQQ
ncbi:MAG: M1 family peptidase, partial [Bacteroidota bacterium]